MDKNRIKGKLEGSELSFFYDILYQYENEADHKGYNYYALDKDFRQKIELSYKQKNIVKHNRKNTICYTGNTKISDLIRHIRNSFSHGNILSDTHQFTFYDEYGGKCTMYGKMDKPLFFRLIKELNKTRK